jgi:threonylcarbamoyladenosine tRNA methylthiotransferase MtaB
MKILIQTLGCKVNQAESASFEGELKETGHEIVRDLQESPDACIINTCTVTAKSDYQSRQMIRRAIRSGARVIATGCYAQLRPDDLTKIKGVDLILGNSEKGKIIEHFDKLFSQSSNCSNPPALLPTVQAGPVTKIRHPEAPINLRSYHSNRTRAFLKIQDGCNFSCSYCTVPLARGKSRSLHSNDVIKAVDNFSNKGYCEIVLTGIHTGSYGKELKPEYSLHELVKKIKSLYPEIRIRLSSIEPQEINDAILQLIKQGLACKHLHVPLQSGADSVLKNMKRGYTSPFFENLIHKISSECPGISIGTDIIAGFPGESTMDFSQTRDLLERLPLSYIHVFPYSQRPDTPAATMKGQVRKELIRERVRELIKLSKKKENTYLRGYLGEYLDVIIESKTRSNDLYRGISDNYIRTLIRSNNHLLGKKLLVKAVSFTDGDLMSIPSDLPENNI